MCLSHRIARLFTSAAHSFRASGQSKRAPSSPVSSSSVVPSRSDLVLKAKHQPIQLFPEVSGGDASGPLHSVGRLEAQDDNGLVQKVTGILQLLQKVPVVDDVGLVVEDGEVMRWLGGG